MVTKGFKHTVVDEDGNYRPQMTNVVLHEFTKTEPVKNFVEKQYLALGDEILIIVQTVFRKNCRNKKFELSRNWT